MSAYHVCGCEASSCITQDHLISVQGWLAVAFPPYARRFPESTVSRATKRRVCDRRKVHGHVRYPTTRRLTNRINRRCSASQTEPAESDNISLCFSALHA